MPSTVRVRLFASAREAVGHGVVTRTVPEEGVAMKVFLAGLVETYPRLGAVLPISRVVRNGELLPRASGSVRSGDEIAIHPPYSGG